MPVPGGVVIGLSRLNRVLEVDIPNRRVTVEPGVTNLEITRQVAPHGYYYAPDPSSQQVCSIGGNVAENSGGAHCLKYGFTVHHVLALDAVMPDGELVHLESAISDAPGPNLVGLIVGSEGTLAVVTRIVVRILRKPEGVRTLLAAFESIGAAGTAVSEIIAAGIVPAAVEMMDALAIQAQKQRYIPDFRPPTPYDRQLDGPNAELQERSRSSSRSAGGPRRQASRIRYRRRAACAHLEGARKPPSPRWDGCRRVITCRTALSLVQSCPRCSHESVSWKLPAAFALRTSSMPAMATCIR